jgi:hypothetical protein
MADIEERVNKADGALFCETQIALRIRRAAEFCAISRDMGVITGEPGVGKTTALRRWTIGRRDARYVEVQEAQASLTSVLGAVCQALDMDAPGARRRRGATFAMALRLAASPC